MTACHRTFISLAAFVLMSARLVAQNATVPNAPTARPFSAAFQQSSLQPLLDQKGASAVTPLTRQEAEKLALANNPRIRISELLAKVQHQVVREHFADQMPTVSGNLTAVAAKDGSRLSSGSLTASTLLEHAGIGVQVGQLITDFGRTQNLVAAARLQEKARIAAAQASKLDILFATDQAFYAVIEAQETLKVATQTVATREALTDQVSALNSSKLKSDLDLSFAQVNLSQAKLLQIDAQSNLDEARASLGALLGYEKRQDFEAVEDQSQMPSLPPDPNILITQAMQNRPDLQSLQFIEQATKKFTKAQQEQFLPTISALGVVGQTPVGSGQYFNSNWYGAVGGNVNIPIFNGFRFSAQASEASLQAQAATEQTRALREQLARDVRTAWLNANTARQRAIVATELLQQANTALDLAKTRYDLGLSSIVELSQAELQQTEAAIGNANVRSQYNFAIATLNLQTGIQP